MNNLLVRFVTAAVTAVTWVIVWQQILYASELPGEGFTASVLTLLVVLLHVAVLGQQETARRLPSAFFRFSLVAGLALLLALMIVPFLWGSPLLAVFEIPLGPYALSSTTLFDVALYLVVSGGMLSAFTSQEESAP